MQAIAVTMIGTLGFDDDYTQATLNAARLLTPIALTAQHADFLITLDSSVGGDKALRHWRLFYAVCGPLWFCQYYFEYGWGVATGLLLYVWAMVMLYLGWLLMAMRARLWERFSEVDPSKQAAAYFTNLSRIGTVQLVIGIEGVSKMWLESSGHESNRARALAVFTFSMSLVTGYGLTVLVRDSALIDTRKLQLLALSPLEGVTLAVTSLYVVTGLFGFLVGEKEEIDPEQVQYVFVISASVNLVAYMLAGRLMMASMRANKSEMVITFKG